MSTGDLLNVQPSELKFPFESRKQSSCSMQLTNKTDKHVAFKVKATNRRKYRVRPTAGIVLPQSNCNITVTMQAQKEAPQDMQCKDKFLLQSVSAPDGATTKDITPEMFNKGDGKIVEEFKLCVVYIPANPLPPVPEESDEGSPSSVSGAENGKHGSSLFDSVSTSLEVSKQKSSEAWSVISKLTEEKASALQENVKLRQELELAKRDSSRSSAGRFSLLFVAVFGLLGILIGYFLKKR